MKSILNILHLEDDPNDAELVQSLLETEGIACKIVCVETRTDFIAAVDKGGFDMILADHTIPSFDGTSALLIAREKCPNVPFIFVSGTLGEELAIESLKKGATDYVLKQRMARLVPAVQRAQKEALELKMLAKMEDEVKDNENKYRDLFQHSNDGIILYDLKGNIIDANQRVLDQFEYKRSEILAIKISNLIPPETSKLFQDVFAKVIEEGFVCSEIVFKKKNGAVFPAEVSLSYFELGGKKVIQGIIRDITKRKHVEEALRNAEAFQSAKELSGAIVHELTQPLQIISGCVSLLEEEKGNSKQMDIIQKMVQRAADLITRLKNISELYKQDPLFSHFNSHHNVSNYPLEESKRKT